MAKIGIIKHEFTDQETGKITPYERLALSGVVGGEITTLELKLGKSELQLAKIILSSKEEQEVVSRDATPEEEEAFRQKQLEAQVGTPEENKKWLED